MRRHVHSIALVMFAWSGLAAALEPQVTARYTETQLRFIAPPKHIQSVCGAALFGLEARAGADASAWMCITPDPVTSQMRIVNSGYFDGFLDGLVREPTSTDRNFIFASGDRFTALDPVTLQLTTIGTLSPLASTVNSGTIFTLMPEGTAEILLNTASGAEIRGFPAGDLKLSLPFTIRIATVGHFLSTQSTQLLQAGNDEFDLFDAHNGQAVGTIPYPQIRGVFGAFDWTGSGLDSVGFTDLSVHLSSMNLSTQSTVSAGGLADFQLYGVTPVNWGGAHTALAGMWYDALRVFDPVTGTVLLDEQIVPDTYNWPMTGFWPADYDSDGKQDLLWTTLDGNLYLRPHDSASRYLQSASGGYQIAGTTGPSLDLLVTADLYSTAFPDEHPSHLDIVVRDRQTLTELWRRTDSAAADSRVFLGQFGTGTDPVLITADGVRIAAEDLVSGAPQWEIDNDVSTTGNGWEAFAFPPSSCTGAACKRMLIASIGEVSNTQGSFVQVVDTTNGATIWSSAPDHCQGCQSRLLAFGDVNGDGVPDIVRMQPYPAPGGIVQVIDGATFQELWHTQVAPYFDPAASAAVATIGTSNVAVWAGATVTLLAAADGHVITTAQTAQAIQYPYPGLRFVEFGANEGRWMILPGGSDIEWLPVDLSQPVQTFNVPAVQSIVAESGGTVFGAGREGVYRMQIPTDHLFANGFEP
jgi:hypothetical protein